MQKTKKEYKSLKKQETHDIFIKSNLFSTWHGYGHLKDLTRRTASDKILCDKVFNIAKNPKFDRYQREPASMVHIFFDKKTSCSGSGIKNENISNKELAVAQTNY